jgi:hypothetical protein
MNGAKLPGMIASNFILKAKWLLLIRAKDQSIGDDAV